MATSVLTILIRLAVVIFILLEKRSENSLGKQDQDPGTYEAEEHIIARLVVESAGRDCQYDSKCQDNDNNDLNFLFGLFAHINAPLLS